MFDILSIDFGTKHIGLALGDSETSMVTPLPAIPSDEHVFEHLRALIKEHECSALVVGKPVSLQSDDTEMTRKVEQWVIMLKRNFSLPVHWEDERLTTALASKMQKELQTSSADRDSIAAMLIAQSYIARQKKR
ncbi:MAG: Holliday junction resolvase RuvX [Parcubacteria group bacterium]|nr:Holliday junction resolvase RuvX [Parcubacteria group bacterium]